MIIGGAQTVLSSSHTDYDHIKGQGHTALSHIVPLPPQLAQALTK